MRTLFQWMFNRAWLLLSLTALFWSGNAIVGRLVADSFPPATMAQLRWIGAALIVLPFAWPHLKRDWAEIKNHWLVLTVLAFTGVSLFNTLQYWSLTYTTALNVLLLQAAMPLLIAGASFVINRERLTLAQTGGIAVSLLGVAAIVTGGSLQTLLQFRLNPGDAAFLLALAIYAVYSALLRRRPAIHGLSLLGVPLAWGAVLLLPITALELASGARPEMTGGNLVALVYVVLFPSTIAYLFFNRGVELIGPNRTGPYFHLVPLFGVILSVTLLGERFTWVHAIGAALIGAGILVASLRGRTPPAPSPPAE